MRKTLLFFLMALFLVMIGGCKKSSDVNSGGENTVSTTLRFLEVNAAAQFTGGSGVQAQALNNLPSRTAVLEDSMSPGAATGNYKYSVACFLGTNNVGYGVVLKGAELTYYKNSTGIGTATWGDEAFQSTFLDRDQGTWTYNLVVYHDEVFTNVNIKILYESENRALNVDTDATFPDPNSIPYISYFTASDDYVNVGESVTLSWKVYNASDVEITRNGNHEIGKVQPEGSITVVPSDSGQAFNTYRLIAKQGDQEVVEEKQIQVRFPKVEYRVSGVAEAYLITIEGASGTTLQFSDVQLPWSYEIFSINRGGFVYVSAQNAKRKGCITVQIYKDGQLYRNATSCGAYVIATASGTY